MTTEHRTSDEIEHEIERDRAELSGTLDALQDKFSVTAIASDLGALFRGQGGQVGRSISQTIGRNPAALAMVGAGVAWLVIGQSRGRAKEANSWMPSGFRNSRSTANLQNLSEDTQRGKDRMVDEGATFDSDSAWYDDFYRSTPRSPRRDNGFHDTEDDAYGIGDTFRAGAEAVVKSVSNAAGSVRDTTVDLTERLLGGTEGFSAEAKERILSARRMAHDARAASQAALQGSGRAAQNLFEDQPLVVGALAVAIGAAIAGALPHSRIEDDAMGAESDRLFGEAQRLFQEERTKAAAALKKAASEARDDISDRVSDFSDHLPDAETAGDIVDDPASNEAARMVYNPNYGADQHGVKDSRKR